MWRVGNFLASYGAKGLIGHERFYDFISKAILKSHVNRVDIWIYSAEKRCASLKFRSEELLCNYLRFRWETWVFESAIPSVSLLWISSRFEWIQANHTLVVNDNFRNLTPNEIEFPLVSKMSETFRSFWIL